MLVTGESLGITVMVKKMTYNVNKTMQSFLVISSSEEFLGLQTKRLYALYNISPFDILSVDTAPSIGIEEVKQFQKKIILSPLQGKTKAGIIRNAHTLTIEAQNALLKTLEEPPRNTILILTTVSKELFLPTILSRCTLIEEKSEKSVSREKQAYREFVHDFLTWSVAQRLHEAEKISKTKESAIFWLEEALLYFRCLMVSETNSTYAPLIRQLQFHYQLLNNTNANTRIIMEHLFLSEILI